MPKTQQTITSQMTIAICPGTEYNDGYGIRKLPALNKTNNIAMCIKNIPNESLPILTRTVEIFILSLMEYKNRHIETEYKNALGFTAVTASNILSKLANQNHVSHICRAYNKTAKLANILEFIFGANLET
jgi:hypothetical protein